MESSNEKKNDCCLLYMCLIKLYNYEPVIFNLVLNLVLQQMVRDYIIVTFYLKYCTKITNKQLQLIVNKYFKYFWDGTIELDIISRFIEFEIKQNRIEFEKNKIYRNCNSVIVCYYEFSDINLKYFKLISLEYIRIISIKSYI